MSNETAHCPANTPMSQKTIAAMTPAERQKSVARVLIEPEEIASAAVRLIKDERLTGRVMLCYEGERWRLVPARQAT